MIKPLNGHWLILEQVFSREDALCFFISSQTSQVHFETPIFSIRRRHDLWLKDRLYLLLNVRCLFERLWWLSISGPSCHPPLLSTTVILELSGVLALASKELDRRVRVLFWWRHWKLRLAEKVGSGFGHGLRLKERIMTTWILLIWGARTVLDQLQDMALQRFILNSLLDDSSGFWHSWCELELVAHCCS